MKLGKNSFLILELLLYLWFMYLDIFDPEEDLSSVLKYLSIILCVVMAWIIFYRSKNRESLVIALALACTAFADAFLLFPREEIWPGMMSFCITHFLYMSIISETKPKRIAIGAVIRVLLALVLFMLLSDSVLYNPFTVFLLSLYTVTFFLNIAEGLIRLLRNKEAATFRQFFIFFFAGLCLFALCDVNVALHNLTGSVMYLGRVFGIYRISGLLMWAFYLPSQVLIVLSSWKKWSLGDGVVGSF